MSRFGEAWRALTGKALPPGTMLGDPGLKNVLGGLPGGAVPFGSPPVRGERELFVSFKKNPVMHSILSRIGYDIAATPWQLFLARNKKGIPEKRWAMRSGSIAQRKAYRTKSTGQLRDDIEEITDHPLLTLWQNPNPMMPGLILWDIVQKYLELSGEAFLGIERNAAGMPVQLWPIPGYWIFRTPYPGSPTFQCNYGTWIAELPETEVWWLKHPDLENPFLRGSGIGRSLGDEIEIDTYAAKTQKTHFYNQGVPGAIASAEGLDENQMAKLIEDFKQKHVGFWNALSVFWVNSKIDFKQLSPTMVEQAILGLRKDQRDKMVSTYGIPPEILGILDHSNRATIAEAKPIYAEHCLIPRLEFIRSSAQFRLVPEFDPNLLLDYVDPTPDDNAFKLSVAVAAPWSRSKNEWRGLQDLAPLDGGDDIFPPMAAPKGSAPGGDPSGLPPGKGGDPQWVRALPKRAVRAAGEEDDYLAKEDVGALTDAVDDDDLAKPWRKHQTTELEQWCSDVAEETGLEVDFGLLNPRIAEYVRQRGADKIKGLGKVSDTTRQQLRDSLADGIDAGESIPKLKARVESVFSDAQGYRAENIARTETTRASGFGTVTALAAGGVEAKEWISTRDSRTRDDHAAMDGQVVAIDEAFTTPDGLEADHPGDFDDPSEDCNCRCAAAAAEKPDKSAKGKARRDKIWKLYDAATSKWSDRTLKVLRAGFATQRAAVLEKLDELSTR